MARLHGVELLICAALCTACSASPDKPAATSEKPAPVSEHPTPTPVVLDAGRGPDAKLDASPAAELPAGACPTERAAACTCTDGRSGMHACIAGHPSGPCMCEGPIPAKGDNCIPGNEETCNCGSGAAGFHICHPEGGFGPCLCDMACDMDADAGIDSAGDCGATCADADSFDGVCPGDPVREATTWEGAVYFRATGGGISGCDSNGMLVPFWPTIQSSYYQGIDCTFIDLRFGGAADELYFIGVSSLMQRDDAGKYWDWPTPPCDRPTAFRFMLGDTYVYQCDQTVYLDSGDALVQDVDQLVLAVEKGESARVLAATLASGTRGDTLQVFDVRHGGVVATLTPGEHATGTFKVLPAAATHDGSNAFVLWKRTVSGQDPELIVYRLNSDNEWKVLRRIITNVRSEKQLVLPDGTVFSWETEASSAPAARIVVWLRDGTQAIAWADSEHTQIQSDLNSALILGPTVPKGSDVAMFIDPP